jgi:hypothetical protein
MAVEIRHSGETVEVFSLKGTVEARSPSYGVDVVSGVLIGGVPYEESYEVTPTMEEQVLQTRSKTMRDDVTVHSIPYTKTSNPSGGYTAIIGG